MDFNSDCSGSFDTDSEIVQKSIPAHPYFDFRPLFVVLQTISLSPFFLHPEESSLTFSGRNEMLIHFPRIIELAERDDLELLGWSDLTPLTL